MTALSTVATDYEKAFVAAAAAALTDVNVYRAWPGPESSPRMVFLTDTTWTRTEQANVAGGRRRRREDFTINFVVWSFKPGFPTDAGPAKDDVIAMYQAIDGAVADAAKLGVDGVYVSTCDPGSLDVEFHEKGYAAVLVASVTVEARLT